MKNYLWRFDLFHYDDPQEPSTSSKDYVYLDQNKGQKVAKFD